MKHELSMKKAGSVTMAITAMIILLIISGCVPQPAAPSEKESQEKLVIGLSLATLRTERWAIDRDYFVEKAKELGAEVIVYTADDDADLQERQAESLIIQGAKVLVVVAQDGEKAAKIVEKAHESGIPVIAYDRLIKNSDLDYYISFDNVKVGESQAEGVIEKVPRGKIAYIGGSETDNNAFLVKEGSFKVLQPLIDSGDIEIVLDNFTKDWKLEVAYDTMKNYLAQGKTVDGVVGANDAIAAGAIMALQEKGLAGKVPVSGQDATLGACQKIVEGTQTVTVYKPLKSIAYQAAEMAISAGTGQLTATNQEVNNGKKNVPSFLLDVVAVTKENMMETVIKDGFQKYDDVYANVPEAQRPPKQ